MQATLDQLLQRILPVDVSLRAVAQAHLDNLTKPQGSLGRLEEAAIRLYCIQQQKPLRVDPVRMFTVAGDHGVVEENVSPFPQAVTRQMVHNFLQGGAAINALCRNANIDLHVVDAGCVGGPYDPHAQLIDLRLGDGTANLSKAPAMSRQTCLEALSRGADLAERAAKEGYNSVAVGEMGIGNTTPATALFCALLHLTPEKVTGPGAGCNPQGVQHKAQVIAKALNLHRATIASGDAVDILAALGGFEIAVMAGIMLGAAAKGRIVVVDGFISTSAYVAARAICPAIEGYCLLSHASAEPGYALVLQALHHSLPLLHLDLRLGEGTGAALAVPLLRAAAAVYNTMATFEQAGVTGKPCTP